jgi:hypothetical protein
MKSFLRYLILVGLPLVGIVGLLQVGQSLTAPISLAGKWSAQLLPVQTQDFAGSEWLLHSASKVLSITQSGPKLRLSFDDAPSITFDGSIRDLTISANVHNREAAAAANPSNVRTSPVAIRAEVDPHADHLVGVLVFENGLSRTEVPLTAIRQGTK